ncbi:MAG: pyridoxamine 5'-phosphate oxidase [Flavobacteriales bacterium]|nr:pyridoxamine 5'-phosphate oxidase [Flavobacteriales bacterium]
MMKKNIADIRTDYTKNSISEIGLNSDPVQQFKIWFNQALDSKVIEASAMVLSTVSSEGFPSGRVLLLKGVEDSGFTFFTNYNSAKAKDMEANSNASMTFFWSELEQQVRIAGVIEKLDSVISDSYFYSRPRASQISAVASNQSDKLENRDDLIQEVNRLEKLYENKKVPRPENWGGYVLKPVKVEFWQGRTSRLHDRFLYELIDGTWQISRLAP